MGASAAQYRVDSEQIAEVQLGSGQRNAIVPADRHPRIRRALAKRSRSRIGMVRRSGRLCNRRQLKGLLGERLSLGPRGLADRKELPQEEKRRYAQQACSHEKPVA